MKPMRDLVLVLPDPDEDKTQAGIYIPRDLQDHSCMGTVVEIGLGKPGYVFTLKKGDRVLRNFIDGIRVMHDGKEHLLIAEKDLVKII